MRQIWITPQFKQKRPFHTDFQEYLQFVHMPCNDGKSPGPSQPEKLWSMANSHHENGLIPLLYPL